ncbi:DMT family transporter [Blastococcus saxobsidens]|uniref:Small multidrug resistance pump n=1 Tax=Blastococcus saxobsidens TaxID=138336 RepID=A0A4Q7Y0Z8_9ACTN|nr:multidrug efflux SMR transporter [Blastococcus saxobsidens]RZU30432.1 small multidrug resistance pump [Blastococcus saxobsidens]
MFVYLLLLIAIAAEVGATVMLKVSDGFSRFGPSVAVVVGYLCSYVALGFALRLGLNLSTGYAVWAGLGAAMVTVAGLFLFQERLTVPALFGIVLIIAGVVLIHAGDGAEA